MASTSKPTDSSCNESDKWDVFMSFGGKDTRKGFVGHLYAALHQAGIRIFKDDPELERGEEIAPQLIDAIRNSKMSIVVFSKNYASSSWCLNELAEIFECMKSKGQIVLPVFYKVDPSSVRHQKRSYAEAFEKHDARNLKEVDTWRAALKGTANVSGYDLKNDANGDEAYLIQTTVSAVVSQLSPKTLNVPDQLVGIDRHVEALRRELSIGSNDVRFLGIYGMPGVGKTTAAKTLYNKIHKEFESSCFLENVRETYENPHGEHYLLERLAFEIGKIKDFKATSVDAGVSFVKHRLRSKRVLIVLDDVEQISQVKSLAENKTWFGPGSRIIVTTRNVRLLDEYQVDMKHEVEELHSTESLELFTLHAFKNTTPPENLIELSEDIVGYIGGIPLALKVLGSSLWGRTIDWWECAYASLKKIPHKNIQEKFIISYNALSDDKVQNVFLDIAFFFIGMDKDDAIRILDACDLYPEIGISTLRERCLLTVDGKNKLHMHNLIRDMGREIVRLESVKNPGKRSRLWLQEDARTVLKQMMVHENIEGLKLVMPEQEVVDLSTSAFDNLTNLRLLKIYNVNLIGSFENIFEELRWLSWKGCSLICLPSRFQAPKLVSLDMRCSKVRELWKGSKQLQSLKILDASGSELLKTTPDFKGLESLEKLNLYWCSSLTEIHPSISLLQNLVHMNFGTCLSCGSTNDISHFGYDSLAIEELPGSIGCLGVLKTLELGGCKKLRNLPSSICNLTSLERLCLDNCDEFERLPEKLGNMHGLRILCLSHTKIEYLPNSIGWLTKLQVLRMYACDRMTNIPSSMSNLTSLETLHIGHSDMHDMFTWPYSHLQSKMNKLPNLSRMNNLIELDLSHWPNLQSLPELPCTLRSLDLRGCYSLLKLPDLSMLTDLRTLDCTYCINLKSKDVWSSMQHYNGTDGCDVYISHTEIADCFGYQTTGSSISFQIPHDIQIDHPRMAFWVVFDIEYIKAVITNKTDGTQLEYRAFGDYDGAVQSWVRYMGNSVSIRSGDRFELSFAKIGGVAEMVYKCGIYIY